MGGTFSDRYDEETAGDFSDPSLRLTNHKGGIMSWSVTGNGKPEEVADQIAKSFSVQKCDEPEESIRLAAASLIALSLGAQSGSKTITVSAYGSQSKDYNTGAVRNSLSITITPQ